MGVGVGIGAGAGAGAVEVAAAAGAVAIAVVVAIAVEIAVVSNDAPVKHCVYHPGRPGISGPKVADAKDRQPRIPILPIDLKEVTFGVNCPCIDPGMAHKMDKLVKWGWGCGCVQA